MTKKEAKLVEDLLKTPKSGWERVSASIAPYQGMCWNLKKDGYDLLVSYRTPIALRTPKGEFVRLWGGYTKTTMGHLSAWCVFVKLPIVSGKMWDEIPCGRKCSVERLNEIYIKTTKPKKKETLASFKRKVRQFLDAQGDYENFLYDHLMDLADEQKTELDELYDRFEKAKSALVA